MTKQPLVKLDGTPLKIFTILISTMGFLSDVYSAVAYTREEAVDLTRKLYPQAQLEVRKILEVRELIATLRENIDDDVLSKTRLVFVRQPKYVSTEAVQFLDKLILAAPALEPEETEQKILMKSLTKIKELYGNQKISRSSTH